MSISDVLIRTDALLDKYGKYTAEDEAKNKEKSNDRFMDAYTDMVDRVNELSLRAEAIGQEKNRALKASQNAELRREKGLLLSEELPKLEKLVKKGKKVTQEIVDDRLGKVRQIKEGIESVPDGVHTQRKPFKEWEDAKRKQDKALDNIEKGIGTLKGIGEAMGESLNQQDVVLDTIDEKMNKVTEQLKTNNVKLKGIVTQMRSSRNFCLDVVLICIILGLGLYLFQLFKKK
ncbi:hypothetical protein COCSUDRAFT_39074 [Coccomyxa subellipsoidea C-169]|uniref:t-SNARE coiled-coil homology domain-containing protein n=1 Tax=Coccomyxa subellipsoidea (strain C-169) TaxID=574566 RepID=I0Z9S0_COCSC|nr:hypothetical protein COCSUDRAFT_39074 [Coccomyxa subellipsoidea C-169]EIE27389.1 hypothetical protein COCSUDRAFT_39074 [Coccomyxa subellipsoidea C-169]|eukprot:XP_005651933.1 hypothetical protein COCSUDRAFT_39074 [Coccomyxa subellipsoidea C-169]